MKFQIPNIQKKLQAPTSNLQLSLPYPPEGEILKMFGPTFQVELLNV
jgi:hypothetical protein